MICVDEFGPLELRPLHGSSWRRHGRPQRFRATYTRPHGVRHLFGAYEVRTKQMWGQIRPRKRGQEFLSFLKALRRRHRGRLWVILDNFSPHRREDVLAWARQNNMRLCFLPTNASWLNLIECQFTPLKRAVLTCCDYPSHTAMGRAIHRFLRWRNKKLRIALSSERH